MSAEQKPDCPICSVKSEHIGFTEIEKDLEKFECERCGSYLREK